MHNGTGVVKGTDWQDVNPKTGTFYGYFVDAHIAITFLVLFSITGAIHVGQSIYHRVWWIAPTFALCAAVEVLGWVGRYWSSQNYAALSPYFMEICCTIIAPSFLAAGLFFSLGNIVNYSGTHYSRFSPRVFSIVFVTCDVVSLVVQAAGGGIASIAFQNGKNASGGSNVMVGGIIFQMFAITLYVITAAEFLTRYLLDKPIRAPAVTDDNKESSITLGQRPAMPPHIKQMLVGMIIATVFLYIRCIYRTIELLGGWGGPIIQNQTLFDTLDGMPIIVCLVTLNIFNPGRLLFRRTREGEAPDSVVSPVAAVPEGVGFEKMDG